VEGKIERLKDQLAEAAADWKTQTKRRDAEPVKWHAPCPGADEVVMTPGRLWVAAGSTVRAYDAADGRELWSAPVSGHARSLAVADGRLIVSTDTGAIHCFAAGQGGGAGASPVSGGGMGGGVGVSPVRPPAVPAGAPAVSPPTTQTAGETPTRRTGETPMPRPDNLESYFRAKAKEYLARSGVRRGYALMLGGARQLPLAIELARQSELAVCVVEPRAAATGEARKAVVAAGLSARRVLVLNAPAETPPLPDYYANLIVCDGPATPAAEVLRMLKPCGGVVEVVGLGDYTWLAAFHKALAGLGETGTTIVHDSPTRARIVRGPLAGAGSWTHEYAEPGNTGCGDDRAVRGPLDLLWFGEPGPGRMVTRHSSAAAPLAIGGRMFVQGEEVVMAYDAYNGVELWVRSIQGARRIGMVRNCSNLAADANSLYAAVGAQCFRLDAATGETTRTYCLPGLTPEAGTRPAEGGTGVSVVSGGGTGVSPVGPPAVPAGDPAVSSSTTKTAGETVAAATETPMPPTGKMPVPPAAKRKAPPVVWEYVARVGGLLYGSRPNGQVFALEAATGRTRWVHDGNSIEPRTICIGGGRVYFIERAVTKAQRDTVMVGVKHEERLDYRGRVVPPDVRLVVALDAATGKQAWARPQYVADCVKVGYSGGEITVMYADGVVLLSAQPWNGHFWREFCAGKFSRRSLIALAADDGHELWSEHKGYRSRPLIVGGQIVAEPWAHDLHTGAERMRTSPVTGLEEKWQMGRPGHHCGNIAAGPNMLFFRSGVTAYYDLLADAGTAHFGGARPGCWINCIPANGVVMMPEAASGCVCAYPVQCTVVFQPSHGEPAWGMYSMPGPLTPAKHLAIAFGAPGDRRDSAGTLWLAYPRPLSRGVDYQQRMVLDFELDCRSGADWAMGPLGEQAGMIRPAGTPDAWLYRYGWTDAGECSIPLVDRGGKAANYTVRLHFVEPSAAAAAGQCAFDVELQGRGVLKGLDPAVGGGPAGGPSGPVRAIVKEFQHVRVEGDLKVTLKPAKGRPVLCGVEAVRED
jgi:outer membrane protein assembly factor BamB